MSTSGVMIGTPVTGDDFFNRDREFEELGDLLERGAHVLVTAPRRIGKSSLLLEVGRRVEGRYAFLYVDVQSSTTEDDAILR
ncbi:MAG TPA: hypothetical protein VKU85_05640, partial [bacterium]|nr:hypothetical protein [bacterium]